MNQGLIRVEVFSAGCGLCEETIQLVRSLASASCEIEVRDMSQQDAAAKAKAYGVKALPAVVINGKLAACCSGRGVDAETLRREGLGVTSS